MCPPLGQPLHPLIAQVHRQSPLAPLGVGLFGGLAQLAMTRSYRYGRTVVSANLSYATVVFASLFGTLLWDEIMPASSWLAIALIISGALVVSLSTRKAG